ncbi:hypothetical protein [uncultured Polaribacter sp.]|uniref:hypothetical protein n=1 Tax=uncultured Polaribacter sp. TaxID=174711 RepID=UPI00262CE342|nr:hypothetical protein [uncultured Polaribacter sp.]
MKKITLFLMLCSLTINSQNVVDSTLVDIPYIGKNGGAHLLNWQINEDRSKIYLYAYSHVNGSQIITNDKAIHEAKKEQSEKSFFGKLLTNSMGNNYFDETVIPVVFEKIISTSDFSSFSNKKELFHKVENIPEGDNVYFKRSTNIIDLSNTIKTGKKLNYYYKEINTPFAYAPKYNQEIINSTYIESKGEGILGLKNIRPILVKKRGFFTYTNKKGFISKTESTNIIDFSKDERLKDYDFVNNSESSIGDIFFVWFAKKKDLSKYQLVTYNKKSKKLNIIPYNFKAPRKHLVINKKVYSKDLKNTKGLINIFSYHKEGKKNKDIYPTNKFDLIYFDPSGNIKLEKQIIHGTEKKYKKVITPILILENNDGLQFINDHQLSIFKSNYETFLVNKEGEINVTYSSKYYEVKGKERINYFDYLTKYDRIDKFGEYYIVKKIVQETVQTTSESRNTNRTDAKVNYTVLDKNFKPIEFYSFEINPNILGNIKSQTVENTEKEMIALLKKRKNYFMVKTTKENGVPKIKLHEIKVTYTKGAMPKLYFGNYTTNFALISKKDRNIYIMNQFYKLKKNSTKLINKVGITKIEY